MRKVLVVGVILLFLGVGFQPALADEVSTNIVSDVDEDCFECQPVNRVDLLRIRLLLIRVEVFTNIILSKFGHIPKIQEKCGILSNRVTVLRETVKEFKPDLPWEDNPNICIILSLLIIQFGLLIEFMGFLSQIFPILDDITTIIAEWIGNLIVTPIILLWAEFCWTESKTLSNKFIIR